MSRLSAEERAKQILQAATEVFAQFNYQSATTSEIARHAQISETLIYHHYESKKDLFLAILKTVSEKIIHRWDHICRQFPSSLDRLWNIGISYIREQRTHPNELKVLFQAVSEVKDPNVQAVLQQTYRSYVAYLEQIIREGQQLGEILESIDARRTAWELVGSGATNSLFFILGLEEWTLEDQADRLKNLLRQIAKHPLLW
ncbi:TetR/AcrR family transcriptional regulator [Effusibacillus pohliae]|uniref:TetR/AcrR family transcriptional regulator n=1 Tax=Effusibacillus pohliae TaxID=232270 RepID=UPI0003727EA0|nr:TetR/AcrR family transcriptional regulator [Effusibacillus pohliae]